MDCVGCGEEGEAEVDGGEGGEDEFDGGIADAEGYQRDCGDQCGCGDGGDGGDEEDSERLHGRVNFIRSTAIELG